MEKSHQVMEISDLAYLIRSKSWDQHLNQLHAHNLYHYQIIVKYRFEEGMTQVLNQILEFTQERVNANLRISMINELCSYKKYKIKKK